MFYILLHLRGVAMQVLLPLDGARLPPAFCLYAKLMAATCSIMLPVQT